MPNKLTRPVKELAADYGPASIAKLVQLRDGAESEQVQFAAAKELLDRAYGRPRQEIDLTREKTVTITINRSAPPPAPALDTRAMIADQSRGDGDGIERS
ncbi:MAG TPA: hypothetical protein VJT11_12570 [Nitrospiraceae bacterium]|nr:hypothetical protein [Nitrospiraceae bacterium]